MTRKAMIQRVLDSRERTTRFWSGPGPAQNRRWAEELGDGLRDAMLAVPRFEPYLLADAMVDLVEMAMLDLPPFPLHPSDLLTDTGFVLFERSIPLSLEGSADLGGAAGLAWKVVDPSQYDQAPGGAIAMSVFADLGLSTSTPSELGTMIPMHATRTWAVWQFGDDWGNSVLWRLVAAFLRLVQERTVVREHASIPRSAVRRAARAGDTTPSGITVFTLRRPQNRPADDDADGLSPQWSHRWVVRGHWRQQWYPSQNRHAPVRVGPYVKGPEGLPLKHTTRIFDVSR